eukprot:1888810-Rhodomonas_salina.1
MLCRPVGASSAQFLASSSSNCHTHTPRQHYKRPQNQSAERMAESMVGPAVLVQIVPRLRGFAFDLGAPGSRAMGRAPRRCPYSWYRHARR